MHKQKVDVERVLRILEPYTVLTQETAQMVRKFFLHEQGWGERMMLPCANGACVRMNWDNLGVYLEPLSISKEERVQLSAINAELLEAVPPKIRLDRIRHSAY